MYCPKCGTLNNDSSFKCSKCGTGIRAFPHSDSRTSRSASQTNTRVKIAVGIGIFLVFFFISGIVAAIAIPAFIGYKTRAADSLARSSAMAACSSAMAAFQEAPQRTITIEDLRSRGFVPQPDVEVTIMDGSPNSLAISAQHSRGARVFVVTKDCRIQETPTQK